MNQPLKFVLTLCLCLLSIIGYAQKTKKTTIKSKFPNTMEVFYVLKDNPTTKHGTYSKSLNGRKLCSGNYTNGKRTGNWEFYNYNGSIDQVVNYDSFTLAKNTNEKNSSPNPVLLGGMQMFYYVIGNTMNYPSDARRKGTQGRVYIKFTITEDGFPTNFEVSEGIGDGCDEEALRTFQSIGFEFFPALNEQGERISSTMTLPVIFKLTSY